MSELTPQSNTVDTSAFDDAYTKARIALMRNDRWAFFSALLLFTKVELDTDPKVETIKTDGDKIFMNTAYFMTRTPDQRVTLLARVLANVALKHMLRRGTRDEKRWEDACAHTANNMLDEYGFKPYDEGWLMDKQFRNKTAEEVFDLLEQQKQDDPEDEKGNGGGSDPLGAVLQEPGEGGGQPGQEGQSGQSGMSADEMSAAISDKLVQAEQAMKMAGKDPGNIPGSIQATIGDILKPKLPMATYLRRFFTNMAKNDYSWRKINRRFKPMMLPGLYSEKLDNLAFAYDMSGSVSDRDVQRYNSEMAGVMRNMKPDNITLLQFDTSIKSTHVIKSMADVGKINFTGRGGTNIECVMEWAKANKPKALIVFTDGEYRHPSFNPGCPVLWMIHGYSKDRFQCDFGTTILFDVEG